MRRIYILPNVVTAFGLVCGLFAVFRAVIPGLETYEVLRQCLLILLLASLADIIDGALARATHAESAFGLMFDSVADVVSFGVAPAVLFLRSLEIGANEFYTFLAIAVAILYTLCGALRLVRFHVRSGQINNNTMQKESTTKSTFEGLPIPAAAAATVAPALFFNTPLFESWVQISQEAKCLTLVPIMICVSYLMISRWRFPSIKHIHVSLPSFQMMFFTVLGAIVILYGLLHYLSMLVAILSWGYILSGLGFSIVRKWSQQKSFVSEKDLTEKEHQE